MPNKGLDLRVCRAMNLDIGNAWAGLQMHTGNAECAIEFDALSILLAGSGMRVRGDTGLRQQQRSHQQEDAAPADYLTM
jgi:hypothetical protein